MFFDSHAHVQFNAFKDDAEQVIRRSLEENTWMILVGSEYKTSRRAIDLANRYEKGVYSAVGLHPFHLQETEIEADGHHFTSRSEEYNKDVYEQLTKFEKVIAVGEIGLDYFHLDKGREDEEKSLQKKVFLEQLLMARRLNKPVIFHCRQAYEDMLAMIKDVKKENKELFPSDQKVWGVVHCYLGTEDLAWQFFSLGLLVSFTGIITFSQQLDDLIRKLPNDKFLIETDCPYLTPEPHRGKRNEPIYVKYVAEKIARIKNLPIEKIAQITVDNTRNLFKI